MSSTDVVIEGCNVSGASDAGIYVGQSTNIIVKNNTVTQNVAGIEIENSVSADVHDNTTHDNTAGVLEFDLPSPPKKGGNHVRVFNNTIKDNNTANFGAVGGIVRIAPAGTGLLLMANHDVEVFGNTISGNKTTGSAIISFLITGQDFSAYADYYPFPVRVHVHDNTFSPPPAWPRSCWARAAAGRIPTAPPARSNVPCMTALGRSPSPHFSCCADSPPSSHLPAGTRPGPSASSLHAPNCASG